MSGVLHGELVLGRRVVEVPDWRRDSAAKISVDTDLEDRPKSPGDPEPAESAESTESKESTEPKHSKESRDSKESTESTESRESRDSKVSTESAEHRHSDAIPSTDTTDESVTIPMRAAS